jgi:phosphoserine aminotransferase
MKYGDARIVASSKDANFSYVPKTTREDFRPDADYVHICFNNTIYGTKFSYIPDTGDVPLVADMSSCIISEPVDVTKFGVIYAGAQKNMAPAGVTVVIVREDLLGNVRPEAPSMLDWNLMAENDSMYNTPPCYSIYMAGLVFEWILSIGGLEEMKKLNEKKANLLYDYLDSQDYYVAPVEKDSRSMMNVTFVTGNEDLDKKFAKEASAAGLKNLKGHRSVGGIRASLYNSMPEEGVVALVEFMKKFAEDNPKVQG